ncbi:U3 small nucleolar RNA-associated protein 15 homolog [Harpegnathos saltator]|uniref:U3 small nucleolar RNA-associated protein 15 homolog n=1 Tax=Harpegnathos saltator TaxID=610380 RepID=E2B5Y5_HARSA|nr:U3 small nucleolar RNA-associated protein 15 homolog [Harpegnathos saltator]EFN88954.1 U3 small nucleolar RNA-associated protein 15-like protein [Harpegnathos saltator]
MSAFLPLNDKQFASSRSKLSEDHIYWRKYMPPVLVKEFGPIDYIDFSSVEPHHFAVTCSVRLQIYNPITKLVTKSYSRFKEAAYGGCFRRDGKLLCAGGEEAVVRLFDTNSNNMLRLFSGHKAAVHRAFFTTNDIHIASFSDDKTVILWDITSEKQITSFSDHTEYIRAGAVNPTSCDIILSGGYDKCIYMYDTRTNKKVLSVNHDVPVESLLFLPSGGIFLSAGGTDIKVFDAFTGGKLLAKITQHHKTVTCLKTASNGRRILSGSLDKHVKVYDAGTYNTLHTLDYPNAVLSIGISADDQTIVAGMVDGMISVRKREVEKEHVETNQKKRFTHRHAEKDPHTTDTIDTVKQNVHETLSKHDTYLRTFEYSKALDCVMMSYVASKTPYVTVTLMQELIRRQSLKRALAGRDGKFLVSIIRFLNKHIGSIHFGRVMVQVANTLLDVYEDHLDELEQEPRKMFTMLAQRLREEVNLMMSLAELQGSLQMILSAAKTTSSIAVKSTQNMEPSNAALTDRNLVLNIT